jgi:hypothetical protein
LALLLLPLLLAAARPQRMLPFSQRRERLQRHCVRFRRAGVLGAAGAAAAARGVLVDASRRLYQPLQAADQPS